MRPTNFAKLLTDFLTIYLVNQKNVSRNTILSYRDTFKILLKYCEEIKGMAIERITIDNLSDCLIIDFLDWIEKERNCSVSTRNQRLAAIHSFFRYAQSEEPAGIYYFQKILSIPIKKYQQSIVGYISPESIQLILSQPNKNTLRGRRDLTLLSTLYDTGARVQELIDVTVDDVILEYPSVIILNGKGKKTRRVPLMKNTVELLKKYVLENKLDTPWKNNYPLFFNNQNSKLTKEGISYILNKYVKLARTISPLIPQHVAPHMLRHSKAMHLLNAGVNLIYIRDFLGHVDIKTTEIYAKIDTESKRKAIENVYPDIIDGNLPDWSKDKDLLSWLSQLH